MTDDTKAAEPCPICNQPSQAAFKPFCSKRCKMRDLAHWLGGDEPYVIPGEPFSGLLDENGEPLVDLEDLTEGQGDSNVRLCQFPPGGGKDEPSLTEMPGCPP